MGEFIIISAWGIDGHDDAGDFRYRFARVVYTTPTMHLFGLYFSLLSAGI